MISGNKTFAFSFFGILTVFAMLGVTAADGARDFNIHAVKADTYELVFNKDTNVFNTEYTYPNSTQFYYPISSSNNPIKFGVFGLSKIDDGWQAFNEQNGFICNYDAISGISKMEIELTSTVSGTQLLVQYTRGSQQVYENPSKFLNFNSATTKEITFTTPIDYFRIEKFGAAVINIKSIKITYSCVSVATNKLTVTVNNSSYGSVQNYKMGDGYYATGDTVHLIATPKAGYSFVAWHHGDEFVSAEAEFDFTMPDSDYTLQAIFEPSALAPKFTTDNTQIIYGTYPQTHVNDATLIEALGTLTPDDRGWYYYNGDYYAKTSAVNNMGVSADKKLFSDGVQFEAGKTYWFKCEPIYWDILQGVNGEYKLVTDKILDVKKFLNSSTSRTDGAGNPIYANNYSQSDIRNWLNGSFYQAAFPESEKYIQTVEVDNSPTSTGNTENQYACANTNDKVYLLSKADFSDDNYGLSSSGDKTATASDYARAKGVTFNVEYEGHSSYLTRSPGTLGQTSVVMVDYVGGITNPVNALNVACSGNYGTRPAMTIHL